jgi:hypothetical protein
MLTRLLVVYSTVVTTLIAAFTLAGSAAARVQHFDEIDVHRINVREPDGTLRMVISNHARLPGVIVGGKEHPPVDRPYAGMLFYNDEGTENGGLVFGGHRNANGEVVDSGRESCYRSHPTERPVCRFSTRTARSSISSDPHGPNERSRRLQRQPARQVF